MTIRCLIMGLGLFSAACGASLRPSLVSSSATEPALAPSEETPSSTSTQASTTEHAEPANGAGTTSATGSSAATTTAVGSAQQPAAPTASYTAVAVPPALLATNTFTTALVSSELSDYAVAVLLGDVPCTGASYGAWTPGTTPLVLASLAEGAATICVKGRDAQHLESTGVLLLKTFVDSTPPTAPGAATQFAVDPSNQARAQLAWSTSGTDSGIGIDHQDLRIYADDLCAATAVATATLPATATSFTWDRFATSARGILKFTVTAVDRAGHEAPSACSSVALRNGLVTHAGTSDDEKLGGIYYLTKIVDVNGDGFDDIVTAHDSALGGRGTITIIRGGPAPQNAAPIVITGDAAGDGLGKNLLIGDITGDGIPEIFSCSETAALDGAIYVVHGNQSTSGTISAVGRRYEADVLGDRLCFFAANSRFVDLDNDGRKELVFSTIGAQRVTTLAGAIYVLRGTPALASSGPFANAGLAYWGTTILASIGSESETLVGDLNGDGFQDVIFPNSRGHFLDGAIYVLLGGATLPSSRPFDDTVGRTYFGAPGQNQELGIVKLADVFGDAKIDIIATTTNTANENPLWILPGQASLPASGDATAVGYRYLLPDAALLGRNSLEIVDLDQDAVPDILVASPSAGGLNRGAIGILFADRGSAPPAPQFLATAGRVYSGDTDNAHVGGPHFSFPSTITVDVTGDGFPDIVSVYEPTPGGPRTGVLVLPSKTRAAWPASQDLSVGIARLYTGDGPNDAGPMAVVRGDFNGDGTKDILIVNASASPGGRASAGMVSIMLGGAVLPASGPYSTLIRIDGDAPGDALGQSPIVADLDHDGIQDVAMPSSSASPGGQGSAGSIYVLRGSATLAGTGQISTMMSRYDGTIASGSVSAGLTAADMTGDGTLDLISYSYAGLGRLDVIPMDGGIPATGTIPSRARSFVGGPGKALRDDFKVVNFAGGVRSDIVVATHDGSQFTGVGVVAGRADPLDLRLTSVIDTAYGDATAGQLDTKLVAADVTGDGHKELLVFAPAASLNGHTANGYIAVMPWEYRIWP